MKPTIIDTESARDLAAFWRIQRRAPAWVHRQLRRNGFDRDDAIRAIHAVYSRADFLRPPQSDDLDLIAQFCIMLAVIMPFSWLFDLWPTGIVVGTLLIILANLIYWWPYRVPLPPAATAQPQESPPHG